MGRDVPESPEDTKLGKDINPNSTGISRVSGSTKKRKWAN